MRSDLERRLKVHAFEHQQADQLRDGHGRMRIVELDGRELMQTVVVVAVRSAEVAQNILKRRAGQDVLLLDAQTLALPCRVVRIQDAGDVLGLVLLFQRLGVILRVEGVEIQLLFGLALPEAERIDRIRSVADDRHVIRHGDDRLVGKIHLDRELIAPVAPRVTVLRPVVGVLALAAVLKRLLEQAEAVAQAVARQRQITGRGAVEEAGGKPSETAVAKCGVLDLFHAADVHALLEEGLFDLVENAHVQKIAEYQPSDQILGGEVERAAALGLTLLRLRPVLVALHHQHRAEALMQALGRGLLKRFVVAQLEHGLGLLDDSFNVITHISTPYKTLGYGKRYP